MKRIFWLSMLLSIISVFYTYAQNQGFTGLKAYNQTPEVYNWSAQYPEYELEYLLNKTKAQEENLTYYDKEKKEQEKWYQDYYANKTTSNVPGSEANPLKYNWYYRSNYTPTYNPMSGNFTYESSDANLTYNPYTQKWEYPQN